MTESTPPSETPVPSDPGSVERRISEALTRLASESSEAAALIASVTPPG